MNNQKGATALFVLLVILIVLIGAFFVLVSRGIVQNPLGQVLTPNQPTSTTTEQPATQSSQYQNPFQDSASSSGYTNPFSSSQNPFNNLK